ncbi:MAG: class I mannose-6-phosphate isomerase [Bacteroidota bacterium]
MSEKGEYSSYRETAQDLLPVLKRRTGNNVYDIYPSFKIADNQIFTGFESLAEKILDNRSVTIDGYSGVFFDLFVSRLTVFLNKRNLSVKVIGTAGLLKPPVDIAELKAPFLGGHDPLFGYRSSLILEDFFVPGSLESASPDPEADINIIAGPGAALAGWPGILMYIDIPKNEIQFRARAGSVTNLGMTHARDPAIMYKSFYFVDWVVLNRHKRKILPGVDFYIDGQRPEIPVFICGDILRGALSLMSHSPIRARPWFEPGAWGGKWIMNNIPGLSKNIPNYAWSFELISPENGLIIESSSIMLEVSFDCLMYSEAEQVLGDCYPKYGTDFPIRFDFLDTFDGGNLSIQCHPRPKYIRDNFGEPFPQEESYYILDSKDDASVYLGFRDDIDPDLFKRELEKSQITGTEIDPERFILKHPSGKHDLFLIPFGTIHGSGRNNLVLEISTTPYIFTFKMYDWVRSDLNGKPRTLNIKRGMDNLFFDRKGRDVRENLICKPELTESGDSWEAYNLPTHETHSYGILRYHFRENIEIQTGNKCLVMSLTEGKTILVESANGNTEEFHFAETFIIPAAAGSIKIYNKSKEEAILVSAFIK